MSAAALAPDEAPRLLDLLLEEQQSLSAVDTFARVHDAGALDLEANHYEALIPVGRTPGAGEQLAFQVDLDACTGCKACVTACHSLNGLAPEETWRDVGLLIGESPAGPLQQTITTACHHCEDPACLAGCPVMAYEKDPTTGIVRHLDDQCIGCQYCVLKCPYDVPKFSHDLGIVRKCDMCTGRLAQDEAPACVQGCPNGAISIQIVEVAGADAAAAALLPVEAHAVPDSNYTRPTTRYRSSRTAVALRPADERQVRPATAHDPLAIMLVLMQLSVGSLLFTLGIAVGDGSGFVAGSTGLVLAAVAGLLGLGFATLHLGRPLYAFRAFLGWRTSWMSREILVMGAYVPAVALSALVALTGIALPLLPLLSAGALAAGLAGTLCSMMIYVDTHRAAWSLPRTAALFGGSLLGLGALAIGALNASALWLAVGTLLLAVKIGFELSVFLRAGEDPLTRTAALLRGPLLPVLRLRLAVFAVGAALAALAPFLGSGLAYAALVCFVAGELVERHLYFRSEASAAMPGL